MLREIPPLSVAVLKAIAKQPTKHINEGAITRAKLIQSKDRTREIDLAQTLIDYITEAGRLTDDVLPPSLFEQGRALLSLKNSKISGKYLAKIINRVNLNLTELDISGTFQVDDDVVALVLKHCKHLVSLNIRNCRKVTNKSLDHIIALGHNLTTINIGGNFNITNDGVNKFLTTCPRIQEYVEINLSGLPIQSDTLALLTHNCHGLKAISLAYSDLGEMALRDFLEAKGGNLQKLCISWLCTASGSVHEQVSAEFLVDFLSRACPQLVELDICGLRNFNAANLLQFLDNKLAMVSEFALFKLLISMLTIMTETQ
jgi:hypothetical protein